MGTQNKAEGSGFFSTFSQLLRPSKGKQYEKDLVSPNMPSINEKVGISVREGDEKKIQQQGKQDKQGLVSSRKPPDMPNINEEVGASVREGDAKKFQKHMEEYILKCKDQKSRDLVSLRKNIESLEEYVEYRLQKFQQTEPDQIMYRKEKKNLFLEKKIRLEKEHDELSSELARFIQVMFDLTMRENVPDEKDFPEEKKVLSIVQKKMDKKGEALIKNEEYIKELSREIEVLQLSPDVEYKKMISHLKQQKIDLRNDVLSEYHKQDDASVIEEGQRYQCLKKFIEISEDIKRVDEAFGSHKQLEYLSEGDRINYKPVTFSFANESGLFVELDKIDLIQTKEAAKRLPDLTKEIGKLMCPEDSDEEPEEPEESEELKQKLAEQEKYTKLCEVTTPLKYQDAVEFKTKLSRIIGNYSTYAVKEKINGIANISALDAIIAMICFEVVDLRIKNQIKNQMQNQIKNVKEQAFDDTATYSWSSKFEKNLENTIRNIVEKFNLTSIQPTLFIYHCSNDPDKKGTTKLEGIRLNGDFKNIIKEILQKYREQISLKLWALGLDLGKDITSVHIKYNIPIELKEIKMFGKDLPSLPRVKEPILFFSMLTANAAEFKEHIKILPENKDERLKLYASCKLIYNHFQKRRHMLKEKILTLNDPGSDESKAYRKQQKACEEIRNSVKEVIITLKEMLREENYLPTDSSSSLSVFTGKKNKSNKSNSGSGKATREQCEEIQQQLGI